MNYLKKELYNLIKSDESIFDFIQESSLDGLWYWDLEQPENEWMNPKFWRTLGYDPSEMPHKAEAWMDIINSDDLEVAKENAAKHMADANHPYDQTVRYRHKNGSTVWIRCRGLAIRNEQGKAVRMLGAHVDVTEEKVNQQLLKETNWIARVGGWEIDLISQRVLWSEMTRELLQVPIDFVPDFENGKTFYQQGAAKEIIDKAISVAIDEGTSWSHEIELERKDGQHMWVKLVGQAEFQGKVCIRLHGVIQDINDRKHKDLQLARSEEEFRQTFEFAAIGMALVSPDGHWIKVNRSLCQMIGYTEEELMKLTFQDITHPDDLHTDLRLLDELINNQRESYEMEKRYFHKDGRIIWIVLAASKVTDQNGDPHHFIAQITDITQRKIAEKALNKERQFLQTLINHIPVHVYVKDLESRKTLVNLMEMKYMGVEDEAEVLGKNDFDLYPEESAKISRAEDLKIFKTGKPILNLETSNTRKDGKTFYFLTSKIPIVEEGEITGLLGISVDISNRKEEEERRRKYAILEAKSKEMEQFAYITSHDLKEPLLTVKGYTNLLKEEGEFAEGSELETYVGTILRGVYRMEELIDGLLDYSRLSRKKQLREVDAGQLVEEIITALEHTIKSSGAEITYENLPAKLLAYPLELKLMVQNLISNAIKFRKPDVSPQITIQAEKIRSGWEFEVRDNGIGLHEDDLEKIFIIFQRLHSRREYPGTGIGLAHCKKIAEIHNGEIWVQSKLGVGSSFFFTILTERRKDN